jgi:hypothetical protein
MGYHGITCKPARFCSVTLPSCLTLTHLHTCIQYRYIHLYNVSCNSCEWCRLRSFKPSSGPGQELGERPWIAAGARDWKYIFIVDLDVDEHFYRTTSGSTGPVLREVYADTCPCSRPFPLTLHSSCTGIPYGADSTFELWGGCCAILLCKSNSVSISLLSAITI